MAAIVPGEVLSHIFSFLQLRDIQAVCCVSNVWREWVIPQIWKNLQMRYFGQYLVPKKVNAQLNWKKLFLENQRKVQFPISIPLMCDPIRNTLVRGHSDGKISLITLYVSKINLSGFKKIITLEGHKGGVTCIELGIAEIISGSEDRTIRVWDLEKRECRIILEGHSGAITSLARRYGEIISGSEDTTIRIWSIEPAKCLKVISHYSSAITFITHLCRYSINGPLWKTLCCSKQGPLAIIDWAQGKVFSQEYPLEITCCTGTANLFFTGSKDGTVRCWDSNKATENFFSGHRSPITGVCLFNKKLYSSSCDGKIFECDVEAFIQDKKQIKFLLFYQSEGTAVYLKGNAKFSEQNFLFGWEGTQVKLWRIAEEAKEIHVLGTHATPVVNVCRSYCDFFSISEDGELLRFHYESKSNARRRRSSNKDELDSSHKKRRIS